MCRRMRHGAKVSREMKRTVLVVAGLLLAGTVSAQDVDETLDAAADGTVEIYNTAGSVIVEGWSNRTVQVTGTLGNEVDEFVFERKGDDILVKVEPKHGRHSGGRGLSSDIVVRVPEGSSLEVATVSADIEVDGVNGEQELQSVSGDVDAKSIASEIEIETVSGDIDVEGVGEDLEAEFVTVSGDISAQQLSGMADLESVNGDVALVGGSFDEAAFETVNGRIDFEATLRNGGELDVETVNGRININFIGDVSADFDIETFNGRIKTCFGPEAERVSKYAPGWELQFTEGGGDGSVTIESLNGAVSICKS